MSKLLYANIARLKSDISFRVGLLAMAVVGILLPLSTYLLMQRGPEYATSFESDFFTYIKLVVIFASAFCSLYIGMEYSDGTIRNKIIIGHKRKDIYLSNLIVCTVAEWIMCLAYITTYCCVGLPLLGFFSVPLDIILRYIGGTFMLCVAIAAIYTLVAMLNQNRAVTSVICIFGIFILIFVGAYIHARLSEPAIWEAYVYFDAEGMLVQEPAEPNPYYIDEPERAVWEFLDDFLPGNQMLQFSVEQEAHLGAMALYSSIIAIVATGFGIFFFCKEDIK